MGWKPRPFGAAVVRVAVVAVPLFASVLVGLVVSRTLTWPSPQSLPWWAVIVGVATATSLITGRLARRLLPLAALLQLSLVFPDRTPSRFKMTLRCGTTAQLRRRVEHVKAHGVGDDVDDAARTVLELAAALNVHDATTRGHSERVRALTEVLAEQLRLEPEDRERLRWSALLHDCGKLMVHADILNKSGPLTRTEWDELRRHPEEGAKLTLPLRGWLGSWALAIEEHHERWDGEGYPNGLAGEDVSYGARIVAVADAYDVITGTRSYKERRSSAEARAELAANAGTQFDPAVVRAFLAVSLGRAGWLAAPLAWIGGLGVVRQVSARAPAGAPGAGLTGVALFGAALFGLFGATTTVPSPAKAPVVAAARRAPAPQVSAPAETEVLGVAFTPEDVAPPEAPPDAASAPAAVTRRTGGAGTVGARVPTRAPAPVATTPPSPPTTVAPLAPPVPPPDDACTNQAVGQTASTPAAPTLAAVRARQDRHVSSNENCAVVRPGE